MFSVNLENISFSYPRHNSAGENIFFSLNDISFSLNSGTFLSILGPNGSGKSTLLRIIARILFPEKGTVKIFGTDYIKISRKALSRLIAFVPQVHSLVFPYTVFEVVLMGRSPHIQGLGFENSNDRIIAEDAMEKVDVFRLRSKPISELSGGELQRVFLARALAQQCPILILDEPNTHLDLKHQIEILTLIKKIVNEKAISVVSVFHDLNLASIYSDEILLLEDGMVRAHGTPSEVLNETNVNMVFGTEVIVDPHPVTNSPRITIMPGTNFIQKTETQKQNGEIYEHI
ncbi:MAG: ABC transporter ATP-binding protein [Bacteroidota bacterium]|nr:ABC transporter ATP-binding protein [Bacteroidota bacterium]